MKDSRPFLPAHFQGSSTLLFVYLFTFSYFANIISPVNWILLRDAWFLILIILIIIGVLVLIVKRKWPILKRVVRFILLSSIIVMALESAFKIMTIKKAYLKDDLTYFDLRLYKTGMFVNNVYGMFGFTWKYRGRFSRTGDTLTFHSRPYDNNFIPMQLIERGALLIPLVNGKEKDFGVAKGFTIYE